MPTYDVLVSDELLPEFSNDNPLMPEGFRIVEAVAGPTGHRATRIRVQDDTAPSWTDGKLIEPIFTSQYEVNDHDHPTGNVVRTTITGWIEVTA